jgi:hypothetical protein
MSDEEQAASPAGAAAAVPDQQQAESAVDPDGPADHETFDEEEAESPADTEVDEKAEKKSRKKAHRKASEETGTRSLSFYGIVSAVLGIVSVAAIAFGYVTWSKHHHDVDDRVYQNHVLRAAANWTGVLVNLNAATVDVGMTRLRGKTAGQFNKDFDSNMAPFKSLLSKIKSRNAGRVESVAIETMRHTPSADADPAPPLPPPPPEASRTDIVLVAATSTIEGPQNKPESVRWNLELAVSDVGGTPLISGFRPLR